VQKLLVLSLLLSLSLIISYIIAENGFGQNATHKCPPGQAPVVFGNQSSSINQTQSPTCKPIDAYNSLFSQ
jgi:hypothetical protein